MCAAERSAHVKVCKKTKWETNVLARPTWPKETFKFDIALKTNANARFFVQMVSVLSLMPVNYRDRT